MTLLNIAVVGGGVGGPCAALGLAQNGHHVTLYECATSTDGVGFAFRITPNSDRCLRSLGVDTVLGGAVIANSGRLMDAVGLVTAEFRENTDLGKAKKGTSVFAYRPSLQRQLLDRMSKAGVVLKPGMKVTSVDVDDTTLTFDDGSTISADLIIAADGVHSIVRPCIVDASIYYPKLSTDHNCLRFTIPKQTILTDSITSKLVDGDYKMFTWKGDEKRIIAYSVDADRQYNFNATHPAHMSKAETSNADYNGEDAVAYNHSISLSRVEEIYSEFDPRAIRLFELADPEGFRVWSLVDIDEIPQWSKHHTVLIGDAAHAVLPFGFAGAGMAIEDGVTLATLLPAGLRIDDLEGRLKLFETIRRPRVARVRDFSRIMSNAEDPKTIQDYREFLGGHDALEHARMEMEVSSERKTSS
ncbi:hypothetical protein H2200_009184 [Cladophialophora chaetospira]|uniref:FAD-binding domain-containing protein n=1 Tax=Cladophialophora chaetospira TaxID=386627 RepID=A0AA38X3X4_9EURO|nr:hypothetical protein H2200_009184 [Cladophialophora chaetospira]